MKKVLAMVFNRWVISALGLLAVGLVIWFVGPLLAVADYRPLESALARTLLLALIFLIYFGRKLWAMIRAKQLNANLFEGLLKQKPTTKPEESAAAEEAAVLSKRFEDAVAVLKQARMGEPGKESALARLASLARRQYVYQLPWYIFIGAPGSGKTTALINSGLKFPLAEQFGEKAFRGVGGTRNCDWWFTDEAVLIDTAGRYTTQESHQEIDSVAWGSFLQLLKKYRPRRPINGVIVTVSVADLLQQTPAQREAHAGAVHKRIHELHEQLKIRFPIYVLVTKADLLAGFMEFFSEYGQEKRAQVWGVTLPFAKIEADVQPLAHFGSELAALERRLYDRLIGRLQRERDPQTRALLYVFPQQFGALKDMLTDFVETVFSPSRFEERPLLRGVYFTSGTQEGSPIDRVMGVLGRALNLERKVLQPHKPSGKSFFLTRLMKDVIFAEAGLAGTNLGWERRRTVLQWGALAIAGAMTAAVMIAWTISHSRNEAYVAEVSAKLGGVKKLVEGVQGSRDSDILSLLPILQAVRELPSTEVVGAGKVPASMGFGLYQGHKLEAAADNTYRRLLRDAFLPRLTMRVEQLLRTNAQGKPELLYEGLKAYIMLHDAEQFDAAALQAFLAADWEANLPREATVDQRKALESHLAALLGQGAVSSPLRADMDLIAAVRNTVARTPLAERIYNRLKHQGVGAEIPEFTIAKAAGPSASLVFVRASGQPLTSGVPGLFSYDGYYKAFLKEFESVTRQLADEEGWVLGLKENKRVAILDPKAKATLNEEVRRLYLEDYARTWEAFINDIKLVQSGSLQQSVQQARILSAPDSPLPVLLRAIVKEVTLVKVADADKTVVDQATDVLKRKQEGLKKLFGQETQMPTATLVSRPESIVDDRFEGLRRMVRPAAPGQQAPVDAMAGLLNELYTLLTATEAAVKGGNAPPQSEVPMKLKAEGGRAPEPVRSMLTTLAATGSSQALGVTRANLSQAMNSTIGDFCRQAITGRYPFVKSSKRDVTQEDFARLFAPGGLMDEFFQKNLASYVDTSTRPWSFRRMGDSGMGQTSGALVHFQRAQVIRDVFFRGGGKTQGLRLDFKPLEMDASIIQFLLDVDGQIVRYSHGPQVPTPVQWPGPRGSTQVRLQISPPSASGESGRVFEGPWALFRMFDGTTIAPTGQPEKFVVTFNIEGRKARFEVITSSVQNPFRLHELEQFQCPGQL